MGNATLIGTLSQSWQRARRVNATDNGFPSRVPTRTKPSGKGTDAAQATSSAVFGDADSLLVQNSVMMKFYGVGSNNNTFSARLVGWAHVIEEGDLSSDFWDPTDLFEVQVTLTSTIVGPTNGLLGATQLFADTITLTGTTANANVNIMICSPANDRAGYLTIDFVGFQMIEPIFTTGASATSCNALLRTL
jgi:hypothetical protein